MTLEERIGQLFEEARKVDKQPPRPRFSNATDCARKHYYESVALASGTWAAVEEKPVRWNAAAACGTAIGNLLEAAAVRLGAGIQRPAELEDGYDGRVCGTADIVWDDYVIDLKCVGASSWREVQRNPKAAHVMQVAAYAVALKKPKWALLYVNLGSIGKGESLEWLAHEGDADPHLAQSVVNHWLDVLEAVHRRTPPVRPYLSPSWECKHTCAYQKECWTEETWGTP